MRLQRPSRRPVVLLVAVVAAWTFAAMAEDESATSLPRGAVEWKSAGALTFAPDGALILADALGAAVWAVEVDDQTEAGSAPRVEDLDSKIAALLGTTPREVLVTDMAVHPRSKAVYLAVSRGRGPGAPPALVRVAPDGTLSLVDLADVPRAKVEIPSAPGPEAKDRRGRPLRTLTITDMKLHDGVVYIAGLSNEEFASTLRTVRYPFDGETKAASIEIYHGAHGAYETHAPIRTLLPMKIAGQNQVLASYTCTPLVTIPTSEIAKGGHVKGKTVAELGFGNTPLDLLRFEKDGKEWVLMINNRRSAMKIDPADIAKAGAITEPVEEVLAGVPYTPVPLGGVQRVADHDAENMVVLVRNGDDGSLSLMPRSKRWL